MSNRIITNIIVSYSQFTQTYVLVYNPLNKFMREVSSGRIKKQVTSNG